MKPVVAVLLSVYRNDRLAWFGEAVDSIAGQTYGGEYIRIYLGIDGPVSAEIDEYINGNEELFYRIIRSEEPVGKPLITNSLIKSLENEEFVFKMDADDISFRERFEKQVVFLREHPEVDIVGSAVVEIDEHGCEIFRRYYPAETSDIQDYICKASPVANPTVCFRRSVFDRIEGYPVRYRYNEDLALWFKCIKEGIVLSNISVPLLCLRVTDSFYRRRRRAAWSEVAIYLRGIWSLRGLSIKLVFPFIRLFFRLLPVRTVRSIYRSNIRATLIST